MLRNYCIALAVLWLLSTTAAHAAIVTGNATLNGAQVMLDPPVVTDATGTAVLALDAGALSLDVTLEVVGIMLGDMSFEGMGPVHIHNAPVGVNGVLVVAFALESQYEATLDGFRMVALGVDVSGIANFVDAFLSEELYVDVHTTAHPAGKIRGQIVPVSVPEPGSIGLVAGVLLGAALARRRRFY